MRFCEAKVYEFPVEDKFLMGFMGSKNENNNIIELGPIISREIVTSQYSNFVVLGEENDLLPTGEVTTITRTVCNDDPSLNRTINFNFNVLTGSKQATTVKESTFT